ncbi:type VI secretion system baseplate subunit TssG [Vannielia litorea]|uniref:type VI secretion system baseplate subunit TssG n=1 Tax=Vannielia litorea TaxID=1217970 RepID=UPI001C95E46F|nr:type VI secretion system baseplate subunit TssG [Vannielia litorea]MBY6047924.1 type VI secretion system baseplate subunit TssG [Vannielia litorea]MBY6075338.1 type VI secretion system baseplate subunit TssG [Vannielia litorea]
MSAKAKDDAAGDEAPLPLEEARTRRDMLEAEPYRFNIHALLRELERMYPDKPRIGRSQVLAQEIVDVGQDPFLDFPASNVKAFEVREGEVPRLRTKFLGFFGPQGPLPILTTVEAMRWQEAGDDAFVRFADIFATRFLQLFHRTWADARPIAQFDRPEEDRFAAYVGSMIGIGTAPYRDRDRVPDIAKLPFAGVMASRVKSAKRLQQVLEGVLGVDVKIREREGIWLEFEESDLSRIGQQGADLGRNTYAGRRVYSINDKAVIEIRTEALDSYESFLPGGDMFERLADMVRFYLGEQIDFDVELALPRPLCPKAQLGTKGRLGYTTWTPLKADDKGTSADDYVSDARFSLHQAVIGSIQTE